MTRFKISKNKIIDSEKIYTFKFTIKSNMYEIRIYENNKEIGFFAFDIYNTTKELKKHFRYLDIASNKFVDISMINSKKKGIGTILFKIGLEYINKYYNHEIWLTAQPMNKKINLKRLIKFYSNFGFKIMYNFRDTNNKVFSSTMKYGK